MTRRGFLRGFLTLPGAAVAVASIPAASASAAVPAFVGASGPELIAPRVPRYFIDATGASMEAVDRLEKMVRALNGSIEARAAQAVRHHQARSPKS